MLETSNFGYLKKQKIGATMHFPEGLENTPLNIMLSISKVTNGHQLLGIYNFHLKIAILVCFFSFAGLKSPAMLCQF